jgi:hypothetical protein
MKQINTPYLFSLGILLFIVIIYCLTKEGLQEPFLTGFVDLKYTQPDKSLSDQQQTYVNVNVLKQALVTMNSQLEKNTSDISNLQKQIATLNKQQSDLVSSNTPIIKGTGM